MFLVLVQTGLVAAALYALAGLVFAVGFHWRGLAGLDPAAAGGGLAFRVLITPGLVVLWPLLLGKGGPSRAGEPRPSPRRLRELHALAWLAIAVVVPLLLAAALLARPAERSPSVLPAAVPPSTP